MFDARIFPTTLESFQKVLDENEATFKGDYKIHDVIFASKDSDVGIDKIFLRLRIVPQNIWGEKSFIVAIKKTELQEIGKQSIIPIKEQFDTEKEAREFIEKNYADQFEFLYEFDRIGWQYFMGEDGIDLEDVEGHPSVEFKSETPEGLKNLLTLFKVQEEDVIQGPSVVEIKNLLKR